MDDMYRSHIDSLLKFLPSTTIENLFSLMLSGVGGVETRRRRDSALSLLLCSPDLFCLLLMFLSPFQFSKPLRTLSPSTRFDGNLNSSDRGRRWCPATAPPLRPLLVLSLLKTPTLCDAFLKEETFSITQLLFHRFGFAQISPEECSHWALLMARESSLGLSDAPCLVESLTAHGEPIFWVVIPWPSANSGSSRSAPAPMLDQRLAAINWFPATASFSDQAAMEVSSRNSFSLQPHGPTKGRTTRGKTLISHMGSSFGMGLSIGPLRFLPRPMSGIIGLTQLSSWPRSVSLNFLSNPNSLMSTYFAENSKFTLY